jgi:hypothetical protein
VTRPNGTPYETGAAPPGEGEERNRQRNIERIEELGKMTFSRWYWRLRSAITVWLARHIFQRDLYRLLGASLLTFAVERPALREDRSEFDSATGLARLRADYTARAEYWATAETEEP